MKKTTAIMFAFWLSSFALVSVASADAFSLTGTIRDFSMFTVGGHPDFENACCGDDHSIVTGTLGLDGKPVYNGAGSWSTHGASYFNQWFNDTPGVNQSDAYTIVLANSIAQPDVYTYSNNSFFPIDGQLGGNQGQGHNFSFTYELNTTFGYQAGQTFTFAGDDDVFVYINGQKVIDLGGVHGNEASSVNLDTLGLTAGNNYALDVFFAERHTSGSDFTMSTNIPLTTPALPEPSGVVLLVTMLAGAAVALRNRFKSIESR